ncbi:hypothetical protein MRX96_038679 [Rhipicephalus microplus]
MCNSSHPYGTSAVSFVCSDPAGVCSSGGVTKITSATTSPRRSISPSVQDGKNCQQKFQLPTRQITSTARLPLSEQAGTSNTTSERRYPQRQRRLPDRFVP